MNNIKAMRMKMFGALAAILAVALGACSEDDGCKFEAIDMNVSGTTLTQKNVTEFSGSLNREGGTVVFEAKGKNAASGYPTEIGVDDDLLMVAEEALHTPAPCTLYDKDGILVTLKSTAPYTTELVYTENSNSKARTIHITFGSVTTLSQVTLTQFSNLYLQSN